MAKWYNQRASLAKLQCSALISQIFYGAWIMLHALKISNGDTLGKI